MVAVVFVVIAAVVIGMAFYYRNQVEKIIAEEEYLYDDSEVDTPVE